LKHNKTESRKVDHIEINLNKAVQYRRTTTGFENVHLIHRALPELSLEEVETSTRLFGHHLSAPILIAGMTGGTRRAIKINANLAEAAERLGLGMGVGSQRAALENPDYVESYRIARERAPNTFLIANIGCPQLIEGNAVEGAKSAVEMIKADALAIHLNPLQEAIQLEGQTNFSRASERIREVCRSLDVPVIAKETGAGIAAEEAILLEKVGVKGLDVGGAGGTSWAAVEYHRAIGEGDEEAASKGLTFWDWGIPTAVSLVEAKSSTRLPIIATGGIRTGIDVAKALALGAEAVGLASPLLKDAVQGAKRVMESLNKLISELKIAMFLTGCKTIEDLKRAPVVITGWTSEWLTARGFKLEAYARRRLCRPAI